MTERFWLGLLVVAFMEVACPVGGVAEEQELHWLYTDAWKAIRDNQALGCQPTRSWRMGDDGLQVGFVCPQALRAKVTSYGVSSFPLLLPGEIGPVEFLFLREGICRIGWVQSDATLTVGYLQNIDCPIDELRTYLEPGATRQ